MREGEWEKERETPGAPARSEITFPPGPKGQRQLSPKRYFNLHSLGNPPATPNVGGSHNTAGRQRLCPAGLEKNAKRRVKERKQVQKSEPSSLSWVKPTVYLEVPGFGNKYDRSWKIFIYLKVIVYIFAIAYDTWHPFYIRHSTNYSILSSYLPCRLYTHPYL